MAEARDQSPPLTCVHATRPTRRIWQTMPGSQGDIIFARPPQLLFVLCALGYVACASVVNGAAAVRTDQRL